MTTTSSGPTNRNTVPVLDTEGHPLMPTRPSRARRLMRSGHAPKRWVKRLFCIQMTDVDSNNPETVVDGVELNIDPGASATGMAITSEREGSRQAHALIELRHRGSRVRNKLERRRSHRRNRRGRLRNRTPRFDNRTRPERWLPPSLVGRLANTMTWVERLTALYPIWHIRVETAVFDTQLMQNAETSGKAYQQGTLAGWQRQGFQPRCLLP